MSSHEQDRAKSRITSANGAGRFRATGPDSLQQDRPSTGHLDRLNDHQKDQNPGQQPDQGIVVDQGQNPGQSLSPCQQGYDDRERQISPDDAFDTWRRDRAATAAPAGASLQSPAATAETGLGDGHGKDE
jgi:hypothetical protein